MSTRFKLSALAGITSIAALQVALVAPAAAQTPDIKAIQDQIQALQKQNETLQKQIQDLQTQVNNAQASADSLQTTGGPVNKEHPGYWQLPGTQTWMTIAGHVKLDAIYDFKQSVGPQDDFESRELRELFPTPFLIQLPISSSRSVSFGFDLTLGTPGTEAGRSHGTAEGNLLCIRQASLRRTGASQRRPRARR